MFGEEGVEGDAGGFDVLAGAFLAVDDADDGGDGGAHRFENLNSFEGLASGGGDIFEEDDDIILVDIAFDLFGGAVVFFGVADEDRGFAGFHRGDGDQGDAAELGASQTGDWAGLGFDLYDSCGEHGAEFDEDIGIGGEPVFVEVVGTGASAAEDEGASEEGGVGDLGGECRGGFG